MQKQDNYESIIKNTGFVDDALRDQSWPTYEANLQSYRNIFLSTQSIMLAVAAIIVPNSNRGIIFPAIVTILAIIANIQTYAIWIPAINARCILVDYHKFSLWKFFNDEGEYIGNYENDQLKGIKRLHGNTYIKRKIRKKVNNQINPKIRGVNEEFTNMRTTRKKFMIFIPSTLTILWIVFVITAFWLFVYKV